MTTKKNPKSVKAPAKSTVNHSVHSGGKRKNAPNGQNWNAKKVAKNGHGVKVKTQVKSGNKVTIKSVVATATIVVEPQILSLSVVPSNDIEFNFKSTNSSGDYALSWDYYDPDGTPQVGYMVNIFSNSAYNNPAWTPENTSLALKSFIGTNDSTTFSLSANDGYVNGGQYWASVKVVKEVSSQRYEGEWTTVGFTVTIVQPQQPLLAVYVDSVNARNELAIQTSDNLFSADNADFVGTKGGWGSTNASVDTAQSTTNLAVTQTTLRNPLNTNNTISTLPIGAYGGLANDISATDTSFVITGSSSVTGPSHVAFTGSIVKGAINLTVSSSASYNQLIVGMVVFGNGIPAGTTIKSLGVVGGNYTAVLSAKATSAISSGYITANYYAAADAIGFPSSGQFWIQIDSERILVQNKVNGANTGDTFTVVKRGYLNTTAASHSNGATVYYGLQEDIYTGYAGEILQQYDYAVASKTVKKETQIISARYSGGPGNPGSTVTTTAQCTIAKNTSGTTFANGGKTIWVYDAGMLIAKNSKIQIQYQTYGTAVNLNKGGGHGTIQVTHPSKSVSATFTVANVSPPPPNFNKPFDILTQQWATLGTVQAVSANSPGGFLVYGNAPGNRISFQWVNNLDMGGLASYGSKNQYRYIPAGTKLLITYSGGFSIPVSGSAPQKILPKYRSVTVVTSQDCYLSGPREPQLGNGGGGFDAIYVNPIHWGTGGDFDFTNKGLNDLKGVFIPNGATVQILTGFTAPVSNSSVVRKVTLTESVSSGLSNGFSLQAGDPVIVLYETTVGATKGSPLILIAGQTTSTTTVTVNTSTAKTDDTAQAIALDYSISPVKLNSLTIGYLSAGVFTPMSSTGSVNNGIYNSAFIPITFTATLSSGSKTITNVSFTGNFSAGDTVSGTGIPTSTTIQSFSGTNSIILSNAATTSGTVSGITNVTLATAVTGYAGYQVGMDGLPLGSTIASPITSSSVTGYGAGYVFSFGSTQGVQPQTAIYVSGTGAAYGVSNLTADLYASNFGLIQAAPSMTTGVLPVMNIPVRPFRPGINFLKYTPVRLYAPTKFGTSAMRVTASGTGVSDVSIYSSSGAFNYQNSVPVNPSQTYGFAVVGRSLNSSNNTSFFSLLIDWYDANGNFISTVDGSTSLTTGNANVSYFTGTVTSGSYGITNVSSTAGLVVGSKLSGTGIPAFTYVASFSGTNAIIMSSTATVSTTSASLIGTKAGLGVQIQTALGANSGWVPNAIAAVSPANAAIANPRINISNMTGKDAVIFSGPMFQALTPYLPSSNYVTYSTKLPAISATASAGNNSVQFATYAPTDGENTIYLFDPDASNGTREIDFGGSSAGSVINGGLSYTQAQGTLVGVFNWNNDGYINTPNTSYRYLVERSDNGGGSYTPIYVKGVSGNNYLAADSTGVAVTDYNGANIKSVYDVEVTPNTATTYRITPSFIDKNSNTIAGVQLAGITVGTLTVNSWWLASTSDPDLRFPINVQNAYAETQKHPVGVFYPLGASRPIIVNGVVQGRDAQINIIWTDLANWDNFISMLNLGEILILTDPVENTKKYIAISEDVTVTHQASASPYRNVQISYVEAPPPQYGYTYGS